MISNLVVHKESEPFDVIPNIVKSVVEEDIKNFQQNAHYESCFLPIDLKNGYEETSLIVNEVSSIVTQIDRHKIDFIPNKANLTVGPFIYSSIITRESIRKTNSINAISEIFRDIKTRISYGDRENLAVNDKSKKSSAYSLEYDLNCLVMEAGDYDDNQISKGEAANLMVNSVIKTSYYSTEENSYLGNAISINVTGTTTKPESEPEEVVNALLSLNIRCQKNNYFEIGLLMGLPIINATNLPSGVIFDGEKIRGSANSSGLFTSTIEVSNGSTIELIFDVDAIQRIF
jgi:hypothetical protein